MDLSHLINQQAVDLQPRAGLCNPGDWIELGMKTGRHILGRVVGVVHQPLVGNVVVPAMLEMETAQGVMVVMWSGVETFQRIPEKDAFGVLTKYGQNVDSSKDAP